jgi:hypothetical protein
VFAAQVQREEPHQPRRYATALAAIAVLQLMTMAAGHADAPSSVGASQSASPPSGSNEAYGRRVNRSRWNRGGIGGVLAVGLTARRDGIMETPVGLYCQRSVSIVLPLAGPLIAFLLVTVIAW